MRSFFYSVSLVNLLCLFVSNTFCQTSQADTVIWNGSQNGAWSNSNNWVSGKKPSRLSTVYIPAGTIHQPTFSLETLVIANLKTDSGTILNIESGVFRVAGSMSVSGYVNVLQGAELNTAGNQLVYYDQEDTTTHRRIVGSFKYNERGIGIDYFGTRNLSGQVSNISSACLYKSGNEDTVYNFTFDKGAHVRTFYVSIKGVKDSSIYKFYPQDDVVIINRFKIDWTTKDVILRETYLLDKISLSPIETIVHRTTTMVGGNCSESDLKVMIRLRNDAIIAFLGGLFNKGTSPPGCIDWAWFVVLRRN